MKRTAALWLVFALFALGGCAVASEDIDAVPGKKVDGGGGGDTGDDEDTGSTEEEDTGSTGDSGSSSDSGSTASDSGAPDDTGSSSSDTGSSSSDTGAPDTGSGSPCTTLGSSDCSSSADDLGSISGDKGGTKTATGSDSKFLRVRVTEDDSALFSGKDLRARVTLTSSGANFDLYVYMGKTLDDGGGVECTTVAKSSTNALGTSDVVALTWNDNRPIGGHDDTRYLSIEVRAADASCAGASWSLTVEGNK